MILLVLDLTCGVIYNGISLLGHAPPWDHLQSVSAQGEWAESDNEGWFYSKSLKEI